MTQTRRRTQPLTRLQHSISIPLAVRVANSGVGKFVAVRLREGAMGFFQRHWLQAALLLLLTAPALAQNTQQLNWCNGKDSATPDQQISGCTAVIQSGKFTGHALAITFSHRGFIYYRNREYDRAISDYDQAIRSDPGYARAVYQRGIAYRAKGDIDRAIGDYSEAIRLDPRAASFSTSEGTFNVFTSRGALYRLKGQIEPAIADYDAAIRLNPQEVGAFNNRCFALATIGRLEQAKEDCDTAVRRAPNAAIYRDSLGFVLLRMGQFDAAIAEYDVALRLDPKLADSLYGRGIAKKGKGEGAGGNADISAAKAIRSDIDEVFAQYGVK